MFKYSFIAVIVSGLMLSACTNSQQKLAERQIISPEATAVEAQKNTSMETSGCCIVRTSVS